MENETYLTFQLGDDYFAVNVKNVLEVLEQQHITFVPRAPAHILGIINFRGQILPVVDTRFRFGLDGYDKNTKNSVIVFEIKGESEVTTIAATADAVKDVIDIAPDEIKPVPELGISYDTRFIAGAIRREEAFILVIEIERVLATASQSETMIQNELIS